MQPVPRIFVSATSRDLKTARGLVAEGLRRMECLPIVQDDFPPDYKTVREMLRAKISTCNAVVHLAGFYYGAEPQPVLPGPDRRSFTQMEYEIAMELKLPCYVFLCGKDFPFDPHDPEPEEKQALQLAHRERLLQRDELYYEFGSPEELSTRTRELQLSVEGLRKELEKERGRRRMVMGVAAAALVVAVGGGIWLQGRQKEQEAVNVAQESSIASLKAQLEGPWAIVNKVNAAADLVRQQGGVPEDQVQGIAVSMVAAEAGKSPDEIRAAIASATDLASQLIAAARAEGQADESKAAESRRLEAETLLKLAAAHEAAAEYDSALESYEGALAILDPEKEPELWLEALLSVGDMQSELGLRDEAGKKYTRAVEFVAGSEAFGAGHRLTKFATGRLASYLIYDADDLAAAEELWRETLAARKEELGPEDADTLRAMGELAEVLAARESYREAADLTLAALDISERVNGEDHEVTMDIVNNLSGVWEELGDLDEAIATKQRVVDSREEQLGPDNKLTLASKVVLAGLFKRNGSPDKAADIYEQVYDIRLEKLGREHPDTISAMESYAGALSAMEDNAGAEKLYRRVLELRESVQGGDHPDTLDTMESLAIIRWDEGDLKEAGELYAGVLETRERTLGPDHADTISSAGVLADLMGAREEFAEAVPLYRRVLAAREETLEESDPRIAAACFDLADALHAMGDDQEALPFARRAVKIAAVSLPDDDKKRAAYDALLAEISSDPSGFPSEATPKEVGE